MAEPRRTSRPHKPRRVYYSSDDELDGNPVPARHPSGAARAEAEALASLMVDLRIMRGKDTV